MTNSVFALRISSRESERNETSAMLIIVFILKDLSVWVDAEGLSSDEIRQRDVRWNKRWETKEMKTFSAVRVAKPWRMNIQLAFAVRRHDGVRNARTNQPRAVCRLVWMIAGIRFTFTSMDYGLNLERARKGLKEKGSQCRFHKITYGRRLHFTPKIERKREYM